MPNPMPTPRWQRWLPIIGLSVWALGAVAIWYIWKRLHGEPGELVIYGSVWIIVLGVAAHEFVRGIFGPVFTYEITRLGRKAFTHVLKTGYIVFISMILLLMYWSWLDEITYYGRRNIEQVPSQQMAEFAMNFFGIYMLIQAVAVVFLTPSYLAGCISDEKERKTLEFLLATDLRNHEIIFGKTAARVAFLMIFVLGGLPILALMQLFGGIDPDLLLSGTAAIVILLLGLSAVSIAFSTAYKRARNAIALSFFTIVGYFFLSAVFAFFFLGYNMAPPALKTLTILDTDIDFSTLVDVIANVSAVIAAGNPVFIVPLLADPFRGGSPFEPDAVGTALFAFGSFWAVVSAICMTYAVFRLRRVALNQAYGNTGGSVANPVRKPKPKVVPKTSPTSPATPKAELDPPLIVQMPSEHPPIGNDPMFWKEVFVEGNSSRRGCWGVFIAVAILTLVFLFPVLATILYFIDMVPIVNAILGITPRDTPFSQRLYDYNFSLAWWCKIATGILTSIAMLAAAVRGAGAVSGEHDRDTWISLISAPLTSWEIIRAKWLGCLMSLKGLFFVLVLIWGTAVGTGSMQPVMLLPSALTVLVLVSAFSWIGILCSLTARKTLIATVRALLATLFFGGGFWLLLLVCCVLPVGFLFDRSTIRELDIWGKIGFQFLAGTPPYMAGWMPIFEFDREEMGPFWIDFDESFGPISMVIALLFWIVFNITLALLSWLLIAKQSNRMPDTFQDRKP
jgi:ABC-type transport system involved in multi-copper enzyme maturation permease subunit